MNIDLLGAHVHACRFPSAIKIFNWLATMYKGSIS